LGLVGADNGGKWLAVAEWSVKGRRHDHVAWRRDGGRCPHVGLIRAAFANVLPGVAVYVSSRPGVGFPLGYATYLAKSGRRQWPVPTPPTLAAAKNLVRYSRVSVTGAESIEAWTLPS
jgi:hypothetical protein